ncbi:NAD dependent epimerase/dehydratase, partial [Apiospora kogelbergensis]|uniref:NAD dependent epimerase/dehydratase n=1 Tax=Apiospora kogelbergensis TaxID=1337665 RepID=UPI00312D5D8A
MGQGHSSPQPGTPFRVIGAGMSRTGTKTFAQALETLIGPVHDGGAEGLVGTKKQRNHWLEVMRLASKKDRSLPEKQQLKWLLAELMDGYSACVDAPCIWLVPELLELYPDAVGTHRHDSRYPILVEIRPNHLVPRGLALPALLCLSVADPQLIRQVGPACREDVRLASRPEGLPVPRGARDPRGVPAPGRAPEKLFFYKVRDGWGPLCEMLKVKVPTEPFPHNNKPEDVKTVGRVVVVAGTVAWGWLWEVWLLVLGMRGRWRRRCWERWGWECWN